MTNNTCCLNCKEEAEIAYGQDISQYTIICKDKDCPCHHTPTNKDDSRCPCGCLGDEVTDSCRAECLCHHTPTPSRAAAPHTNKEDSSEWEQRFHERFVFTESPEHITMTGDQKRALLQLIEETLIPRQTIKSIIEEMMGKHFKNAVGQTKGYQRALQDIIKRIDNL